MDLGWRIEDGGEKQKNLKWAKNLLPEIPESVATIEDAYQVPQGSDPRHQSVGGQASGTKTVILIQDAHTNTSCQLNESKLFAILFSHAPSKQAGGTPTVFTEAAQGNVNLTFLRDKASLFKRKQIANEYLQKGLLHGIEYLDLTSDHNFKIEGVEDPALYFKSLQVYKDSVKKRDSFDRYLTEIESTISVLKSKLLNPFLLSFLNTKDKQKDNLSDYIQTLINQAQILNLDLSKYPTIQHLQSLKALESKIDFKLASAEQQKATQSLSVEDQKELSSLSVSKLTMKDSQRGFFLLLEEKLKDQIKNYPNLSQYFKYLDQSKSLSPKDLLNEQKSLESQVLKALATNQDEEKLLLSIKTLSYYKKLFFLTLTPEEYQDSKQENFTDLKVLSGFLNQKLMNLKDHYDKAIFLKEDFTDIQNLCTQFYELTYQRDQAFISNMFKVIENTPYPAMGDTEPGRPFTRSEELHEDKWAGAVAGPVAAHKYILITGGYHTPNLKHLLRQHSISYISITPQVTQETNVKRYEEILLSQPVPTTQQLAFNATATTMDMTGYTLPATTPSSAIPGPMESAKLISELEKQAPTVNKQSRIKNGRSPRRVVTRSFNQSGARLAEQSNVPSSGVPEKDQLHSGPYEIQLWQWALNFAETFLSNQKRKKTLIQVLKSYVTRDPIKSAASKVAHDILSLKDLEAIRGWSDALDRLVQSAPELEDIRILDSHEGVARELLKATWAYLLVYREEFNSSRRDFLKMTAATAVSMHISPYQQLMSPRLVDVPRGKSLSSLLWDELHASVRRNANLGLELARTGSDKSSSLFHFTWGNDNPAAHDALRLFNPKFDLLPDPRFSPAASKRRQRVAAINRTDPAIFWRAREKIVDYDRLVDLLLRLPPSVVKAFRETNTNWQDRLSELEGGTPSITAIKKRELAEEIEAKENRLKNLQKSLSTLQDDLIASPMHQDYDLYSDKYARQKNFLQIKIRDLNESIKNLRIQLDYFNSGDHSWLSSGARMAKEEVQGLAGIGRTGSTIAQNPYAFGDDTSIPDQWHENLSWISRVQQLALIYMAITFLFHDPFLMISRGWSAWGFASVASAMAVVSPWIRYGSVLLYVGTLAEIWRQFRQTNREIELFRLENTKDFVWQNKRREDYYESEIREALRNNMGPLEEVPLYIRDSGNVFSNLLFSIPFLGLWSLYFFTLYLNSDMAKNTIVLQTAIQKVILRRNATTVIKQSNLPLDTPKNWGARLARSGENRQKRLGLMATPKANKTKPKNNSMPLILTSLLALIFGIFLFMESKFTTFIAEVAKLHENGPPQVLQPIDPSKAPKTTESITNVEQPSEPFVKLEIPSEPLETPVVDQTSPDDDAIEILPVEPKQISQGFDLFTHMAYSSLSSGDSFTPMTQAYTDSTSFSGDPRRSGEYEITVKVVGILAELSGHSTADEIFLVDAFNDLEEGKLKRTGTVKLRPQGEPTGEEVKVKIIIPSLTEGQKMQLPNLPNGRVKVLNSQRYGISIDASGLMNANKPLSGRVQITYVIEKMSETSFVEGEVPLSAWLQKEIEAIPEPIKKELESVRNGTDRQKLEKIAQIFNTYTAYQTGKMEIKLPSGMTWGKYWDNNLKQYKRFLTNCGPLSLEAFIMTRAVGMKSYFFLSYANQPNSWLITSNEAHATTEVEMDGQMIVFEPTIFSPLLVGDPRSLLATHDLNWEVRKQSLTPEQNNQSDLAEKVSKAAEEATKEASGEISAGEKKEVPDQKVSEHRSKMFDVSPEIRAQMTGQVGQAAPGDSQSRSVSGSGGFSISTGNLRLSSPAEFEAFMKALQELGRVETTELEPWKLQDLLTRLKDSDEAVVFKALVEISNARAASVYGAAYPEIAQILRETILSDQPVYIRTQAIKAYLEIGELPELIPENAEFLAWLRVGVDYHPRRTPSWKDLQMSEVFREEYIRRLVLITTRIRLDSPKSKTSVEALTEMGDHPLIVSALLEMYVYRGGWLLSDSYPLWEIHNYFFRRKEVALDLGRSDYLMNAIPDTPDRVRDLTNFLILRTIAEYARDESVHENLIAVAEEAEKRLKAMDRKTALDALVQVVTADPIPIERKGEKGFSMYDDLSTYWSLDFKMHVLKFLQGFEDWNQGGVGDAVYNSLKPDVAEGTSLRRRPGATNESVQHAIGLFGEVGTMDDLPLLLDALKDEFQSSGRRIAKDEYGYNLARTILRIVFRKTNPQEWWSWLEERPDADEILIHLLHVADDEAKNRVLVDGISYGDRVKAELMRRKASSVPALLDALRNPIRNPAGQIADILRQLNITEAVPLISANLLAVFASDVESSKVYDYSYKTNYYESDSPRTWDMNLEINALGSLGTPEALETLLNIVSHPHASIRHQIIPYLKPAHHEKAVELLLTAALNRTKLEREYSYINNIAAWVNSILEIPTEDAAKAAIRVLSEKILPVSSEENALYGYEDISQVLISLSHSRWPVAQEFLASMAKKSPSQYYEYRAIILLRNVSSDISVDTLISIMDSKGDGEQQKSAAAAGSLFVLLGDNQLSVASKEKVHKSLDQYLETLNKEDPGAVVRMAGLILGVGNDWQVDNKSLDATVRTLADVEETPNIRGMAASLAREILRSHNTSESRIKGETATIMQERLDSYQKENPNGARLSASKAPEQKALTRFFAGLLLAFSLTGIQDKALAIETDSSPTVFTITSNGARLVATSESGLKIELSAQEARGMLSATEDKSETLSIQDIVLVEKTVDTRIAELLKDIDPRTPVVVMVDLRVLPKNAFEAYVSRLATAAIQLKKDNIRVEVVGPQELIDRLSAESVKAFITKLERIQALSEGALLAKLALPNQGGPEATFIPFAQLERGHVPAYAAAARLAAAGARIGKGTIPTGFTDAWAFLAGVEDGLSPDDARQVMKGANKELGARLAIKPLLHARVDVVLREFDMIKRQVQSAA